MLVIVEGIDRVGKTTLCEKLGKLGFITLKDAFGSATSNGKKTPIFYGNEETFPSYSIGKLDTAIQYMKQLSDTGINIVADRLHLTELVYGSLDRAQGAIVHGEKLDLIDKMIANEFGDDVVLIYVKPTDVNEANERAGRDLSKHDKLFSIFFETTHINDTLCTDFYRLDMAVWHVVCKFKYDFYLASPFFRPDQVEREERIKAHLRSQGYKVFSPKEACHLHKDATPAEQATVFNDNLNAIKNSMAVFAITDTKDVGTIWEAGYAFGIGKPIIYFAETLGDNQFNLMLAKSGKGVFTSQSQLNYTDIDDALLGEGLTYGGLIE